jgi:uncharacterized membrane protein
MDNKKNLFVLLLIPLILAIAVIVYFSVFYQTSTGTCQRMVPIYVLWISLVVIILIIVPTSYFLISKSLEEKLKSNMEFISNIVKKEKKGNLIKEEDNQNQLFLKFLNLTERKVFEKLIENKGIVLQSEISRMEGMTRLKTHRAVRELERKGIIKIESFGKSNRIILTKDIKNLISK